MKSIFHVDHTPYQGATMQNKYLPTQYELTGQINDKVLDKFLKWANLFAEKLSEGRKKHTALHDTR